MTISINYDDHSNEELSGWLKVRDRDLASASERCERLEADVRELGEELLAVREQVAAAREVRERTQREFADFKLRVRARMIEEAERRGWCTEFDDILEEFGLERRTGNYVVRFEVGGTVELTVLARGEDHATDIASRAIRFFDGQEIIGERDQTLTLYSVTADSCERDDG